MLAQNIHLVRFRFGRSDCTYETIPVLNLSKLTEAHPGLTNPNMDGPDRRRLYRYVCAAIAAKQTFVWEPSGHQAILEAKYLIYYPELVKKPNCFLTPKVAQEKAPQNTP